jgi:hypothetical protein|tara:strand:- start:69 stop:218 length:150 start_codon:yes stop_codon:yes gene_type:complete
MEPRRDILTELWEVLLGEKAVLWDAARRLERWVLDEKKKEHGKTDTKND